MTDRTILHGGDYNPEQWLDHPDILEKDIEYMKKAHINTVTVGMFSWSSLEPEEGKYDFGWLKERVDRLYENGISVIMGTPSGARPKWMADRYPEVLRVDEARRRQLFGGRHNHCYTSPVYREKIRQMNTELGKQFGSHPAILMWHISNEYGGECHCPLCQEAFRQWLKKKYGTIDAVNQAWCTAFWSHTYQSFEQIESPSSIGETMVHGLNLDWKRFVTAQTVDFLEWEIRALREAGATQKTTVNLMYDYGGLNYRGLAGAVDVVSWDNYPVWHKEEDIKTARDSGMQHDFMRSLKKQPFLLMESCPASTNWHSVSKLKRPGLLQAASWQAVAHGSDSVLYFQIRQSRGSSEKFHGAVIDHYGGDDTRVFREVSELGSALEQCGELTGTCVKANAAVIYDVENRWAIEDSQGPRNKGMHYHEAVMKSYSALRKLGYDVDVITMEEKLDGYQLVAAPMLYLFRGGVEEKLREYTAEGGTLVMTYWSGIVDETDRCYLGGVPHGLRDVLGIRSMEIDGLYDDEKNYMVSSGAGSLMPDGGTYECRYLCELVKLEGAEALMLYRDDFYQGYPALTRNTYGKGTGYYICADAEQSFYDDFYDKATRKAGMKPLTETALPDGVEVSSRESDRYRYLFIQNFNSAALDWDIRQVMKPGDTLLLGEAGEPLAAYGTLIIKREKCL